MICIVGNYLIILKENWHEWKFLLTNENLRNYKKENLLIS
jgi:hypothetical protein